MSVLFGFGLPPNASTDELRAQLDRLEGLIARAPVPIAIAHDVECRMVTANAALSELLGVEADTNISLTPPPGQEPQYRIQRDGRDIPTDELPMQYAMAHRTTVRNDIEIVRPDGAVLFIQNDVEPLYDSDGNVSGCVSVCVDLTEQRRAERVLRETDRRKDEFLASLSHELRSPLAPIRDALDALRRSGDPLVSGRAYAVLERQLYQLTRLTDDLLDVSRITHNKIEVRRQRIDLRLVVQSAIETTKPLIDVAGHLLRVEIPRDPIWMQVDFTRMAQAFASLLNNAVKYTSRGGRITVRVAVEGPSTPLGTGPQVVVSISDTGIGIAADALPRVFDMFVLNDASRDGKRDGLGIGLTLAKRLIELHDGTIEAASDGPGLGSTFIVRLPASAEAAGDPARR